MLCRPNELAPHVEASRVVDVFSPNHLEMDALCGRLKQQGSLQPSDVGREHIESCAVSFMEENFDVFGPKQLVIIRSGEHGVQVARRTVSGEQARDTGDMTWVEPFYSPGEQDRTKDARGAGNLFLGAFTVEFQQNGGDAVEVSVVASVAASFVVEQVGLPTHETDRSTNSETWNGTTLAYRMKEYEQKLSNQA